MRQCDRLGNVYEHWPSTADVGAVIDLDRSRVGVVCSHDWVQIYGMAVSHFLNHPYRDGTGTIQRIWRA